MLPFRRIFHPTDFSPADSAAFAHAVKLTCLTQGELTMMHVDPTIERKNFEDFPRIRPLLVRWGILQEGCSKDDVAKLGVQIKRVRAVAEDAASAILQQLTEHPTELLVLSTHQREGLARLTHHAVAEPVARGTHARTLFVPAGVAGFVSAETGRTNLTRVLIPSPIRHTRNRPSILPRTWQARWAARRSYSNWYTLVRKTMPQNLLILSAPAGRGTRSSLRAIRLNGS